MSHYFELLNDNGNVMLDDSISFLHVSRKGTLASVATFVEEVSPVISWESWEIKGYSACKQRLYTITLGTGEYNVAFAPQMQTTDFTVSAAISSGNVITIAVNCLSRDNYSQMDNYINNLMVYVVGDHRATSCNFGLELYNESGEIIYQLTDQMVNVVGRYYATDTALGITRTEAPDSFSSGYTIANRAVMVNSIITGIINSNPSGQLLAPLEYTLAFTYLNGYLQLHSTFFFRGASGPFLYQGKRFEDLLLIDISNVN